MESDGVAQPRRRRAARRRIATTALSVAAHLGVAAAVLTARPAPPPLYEAEPMVVALVPPPQPPPPPPQPEVTPPKPTPAPPAPSPAPPKPEKARPPKRTLARPARTPPDVEPVIASPGPPRDGEGEVSEAQLAGAGTAESGGGGGGNGCNMTRWLQGQLRKDRLVRAALAEREPGKALMVWNGDWIRHSGQDGAGLAAVRESLMWEIAFAPEACRAQPVHGLVLISLNDGPGGARLVLGSGVWRWSDLLSRRR